MRTFYFSTIFILLTSCATKPLEVSQINFKADACFGTCPIFTMTIMADGTAHYNAKMYNERQGEFSATIRKSQFDSLKILIEKASFFNLKNEYSTDWTDQPTYTVTVKLKNGQSKQIRDYGPSGPDKLRKVYDFIFSLRQSQKWK
ncbi:DUF6438 domain-containing protein [Solitalea sp. MAHUQ-68]|uniref:DUF6438 domain-containing protein n=1 Tax=Solitalea agri TaxID=2953739 RepID=A0A9X2F9J2_9SPHI|nr:DUF6438 domain-containing protein [Solitalea agri]MCO4294318.1 DUF6438 domain-containing protein [Solitalea agri]